MMLDNPSHHVGYVGRCFAHHSTLMSKTLSGDIMLITATKYATYYQIKNIFEERGPRGGLCWDKSLAAGHGLISALGCRLWVPEEERENHDRLVIIHREQFYYLNPDGFPKKGSIFKLEPHKIDLWILQTFTHTFDLASLESLGSAWSHAQQDNLPLMEIYHEYFDAPWLEIEPIYLHANITEISHLGKFLYKEHNVPEPFCRHSRDKKSFTDDLDSNEKSHQKLDSEQDLKQILAFHPENNHILNREILHQPNFDNNFTQQTRVGYYIMSLIHDNEYHNSFPKD
ncbi:hypothetical protein GLOIN_2v1814550 [Rhizophagus irregularis DAOM 181602=DAOM 197198]|nr:hypothetical protein GLOIN_2v1814550 [Rhizophagus irregularis DAOM 181602=DAOM 197198]